MKAAYVKLPFSVEIRDGISYANPLVSFDANAFHFKRLQLRATYSIQTAEHDKAHAIKVIVTLE